MEKQNHKTMDINSVLILLAIGVAAGILSGVVGIGGGIIIVPALIYFLGFDQKTAQGTSLAVLLLPIGVISVLLYYKAGYVNVRYAAVIVLAFLAGSYFGSKIALGLPQETLKKIFAVLMVIIAVKMLWPSKASAQKTKTNDESAQVLH